MPKKKKEPEENPMAALPLGMSFALAQNPEAMAHYARMDKAQQDQLAARASNASSKEEMRQIVDQLGAQ